MRIMQIKKLFLQNFRNYESESFDFSDGLNVLFGKNAQGKTNCAEAVFYLCTGYSPRATRDKQVIRYGADKAYISMNPDGIDKAEYTDEDGETVTVDIGGEPFAIVASTGVTFYDAEGNEVV